MHPRDRIAWAGKTAVCSDEAAASRNNSNTFEAYRHPHGLKDGLALGEL